LFQKDNPSAFDEIKRKRKLSRPLYDQEFFRDLEAKDVIVKQYVQQLVRSLE